MRNLFPAEALTLVLESFNPHYSTAHTFPITAEHQQLSMDIYTLGGGAVEWIRCAVEVDKVSETPAATTPYSTSQEREREEKTKLRFFKVL